MGLEDLADPENQQVRSHPVPLGNQLDQVVHGGQLDL